MQNSQLEKYEKSVSTIRDTSPKFHSVCDEVFENQLVIQLKRIGAKDALKTDEAKRNFIDNELCNMCIVMRGIASPNSMQVAHDYLFGLGEYADE